MMQKSVVVVQHCGFGFRSMTNLTSKFRSGQNYRPVVVQEDPSWRRLCWLSFFRRYVFLKQVLNFQEHNMCILPMSVQASPGDTWAKPVISRVVFLIVYLISFLFVCNLLLFICLMFPLDRSVSIHREPRLNELHNTEPRRSISWNSWPSWGHFWQTGRFWKQVLSSRCPRRRILHEAQTLT